LGKEGFTEGFGVQNIEISKVLRIFKEILEGTNREKREDSIII
jgi:hypothetical protein